MFTTEAQRRWKRLTEAQRYEVLSWLGDPNRGHNLNAAADVLIELLEPREQSEFREWQKRR